jgi:hypothetical protein
MTRLPAGQPKDHGSIPGIGKILFLFSRVATGTEAHPASYLICTGDSFPGDRVAKATNTPYIFMSCRGKNLPPILYHDKSYVYSSTSIIFSVILCKNELCSKIQTEI